MKKDEMPEHMKKGLAMSKKLKEDDVRVILVKDLRAYIDRNDDEQSFLYDIQMMGGTFGEFYGSYDTGSQSKKDIEVKLEDGRIFKFNKRELYSKKPTQVVLL